MFIYMPGLGFRYKYLKLGSGVWGFSIPRFEDQFRFVGEAF